MMHLLTLYVIVIVIAVLCGLLVVLRNAAEEKYQHRICFLENTRTRVVLC